jgi:hypothetical protein
MKKKKRKNIQCPKVYVGQKTELEPRLLALKVRSFHLKETKPYAQQGHRHVTKQSQLLISNTIVLEFSNNFKLENY